MQAVARSRSESTFYGCGLHRTIGFDVRDCWPSVLLQKSVRPTLTGLHTRTSFHLAETNMNIGSMVCVRPIDKRFAECVHVSRLRAVDTAETVSGELTGPIHCRIGDRAYICTRSAGPTDEPVHRQELTGNWSDKPHGFARVRCNRRHQLRFREPQRNICFY